MSIRTKEIKFIGSGTEITGQNSDTITNPSSGVWNFGGATLQGAVLVGNEALAQSDLMFWVDSSFSGFPSPFFETIQDAIDACSPSSDNRYLINILPGNYDGFIIDSKQYITIQGLGLVHVGTLHSGTSPKGIIKLKDTDNCILKNLILPDTHYNFNTESEIYVIELENSACNMDGVIISFKNQIRTSDYTFSAIKIGANSKNISIKNTVIDLLVDCGSTNPTDTTKMLHFIDPTDSLRLNIDNLKCRFKLENWSGSPLSPFTSYMMYIDSASVIKYFVNILNSQFEMTYDGGGSTSVLGGPSLNYDACFVGNSLSNLAFNINTITSGVIEDSNFTISDEIII